MEVFVLYQAVQPGRKGVVPRAFINLKQVILNVFYFYLPRALLVRLVSDD